MVPRLFVLPSVAAVSLFFASLALGESPGPAQEMIKLAVRVVDADGKPVPNAKVIPWALRSSQGHGQWRPEDYDGMGPPSLTTDKDGDVEVPYPKYRYLDERVLTTQVTLSIDHPEFACVMYEFIDVPLKEDPPHTAKLERGCNVEVTPLENGQPTSPVSLKALWSDDRSWKPEVSPEITETGALRIPAMPAGKGQVLLARLDGERVTHFSSIVDLELKAGDTLRERVELRPAVRIKGKVSDNVPRPIKEGRLSARTLSEDPSRENVMWFSWAVIAEDGTFTIGAWPAGEPIQIVALCDGYIAEPGSPPAVIKDPRNPDPYYRPQVFDASADGQAITLKMTPMLRCIVETVDDQGKPLADVEVSAWPNVGWWNGGSQVYCAPLIRGEKLLVTRDYIPAVDDVYPKPFQATSDSSGLAELQLPASNKRLSAENDGYELPVAIGRRDHKVELVAGETNRIRLVLQPKGKEYLGEWDKLAGVLFGCTGEQCRRLLEDPEFRAKMDFVRQKLDAAKDPNDPLVLNIAFIEMAAAFDDLDDKEEATKWRRKAAEQAAKLPPHENDGGWGGVCDAPGC